MPTLRLAYVFEFLIAVIAVFVLWSEVGGQVHLDLIPWYLKLGLGVGAAFAVVKATAAAVEGKSAWNVQTLKWLALLMLLLVGCGLAAYYAHMYGEEESPEEQDEQGDAAMGRIPIPEQLRLMQPADGSPVRTIRAAQIRR
jgi:hypothetical protein